MSNLWDLSACWHKYFLSFVYTTFFTSSRDFSNFLNIYLIWQFIGLIQVHVAKGLIEGLALLGIFQIFRTFPRVREYDNFGIIR